MANRNVHAGMIIVSYPSSIKLLMNVLVKNSQIFMKQNQLKKQKNNYYTAIDSLFESITSYIPIINNKIDTNTKNNVIDNFITDLKAIRKIKGKPWELSTANDITHGVVFIYLTQKAGANISKSLIQLKALLIKKTEDKILSQFSNEKLKELQAENKTLDPFILAQFSNEKLKELQAENKILAHFSDDELKELHGELKILAQFKFSADELKKLQTENGILAHFSDDELKKLHGELKKRSEYINRICGTVIGTVRIHDGVEITKEKLTDTVKTYLGVEIKIQKTVEEKKNIAYARLDPQLKKILIFKNPITHDELSTIKYPIPKTEEDAADAQTDADAAAINDPISQTDETVATNDPNSQTNGENFGVFRGRSMILPDEIAIQIVAKLREKENKLSWLDKVTFGEHALEKYEIRPQNYQEKHKKHDVFSGINKLTEQQVRSYFLNYVVDELDDSKSHINRTIEIKTANGRADYFVSINGVYIPFEAKIDAKKNKKTETAVLHQIQKYAHISEFERTVYDATIDKLIKKTIPITKPHGVVLIGDKKGIYLAYSDSNGKGYFVARNGQNSALFWSCKEITPKIIEEIKACVYEMYELNDKFIDGNMSTHKKLLSNTTYNLMHKPQSANSININDIITARPEIIPTVNETSIPETSDDAIDIDYIISALQPLRPYAGADRMLMNNVALLADSINAIPKDTCPVESLWLCTPVSNNVYFIRIDDVWFPVHINYTGTLTAIDYKKYTYVEEFQAPSAVISIEEHGISLVASTQGLDIMYTDENGNTTTLHEKIAINTTDARTQARDTISEYYNNKLDEELE
jgi:hypothetical protein